MTQSASDVAASDKVPLAVVAAERTTEIFLIDGSLTRVASAIGRLDTEVVPGIYKIRYRSGNVTRDELIEVPPGGFSEPVTGRPMRFATARPLMDTLTTHEYQYGPARHWAEYPESQPRCDASSVLLFHRESDESFAFTRSAMSLWSLDGTRLEEERAAPSGPTEFDSHARYRATRLNLDPGTYALRAETASGGHVEIFFTVCCGWETQIFVEQDGSADGRLPALHTASVAMAQYGGPAPDEGLKREAEIVKAAFMAGRRLAPPAFVEAWLSESAGDPVTGLCLAHALLQTEGDDDLVIRVIARLSGAEVLGAGHPDVQGLIAALAIRDRNRVSNVYRELLGKLAATGDAMACAWPPMLRDGWEALVKLSKRRATVIPPNSFNARMAADLVGSGSLMMRRVDDRPAYIASTTLAGARAAEAALLMNGIPDEVLTDRSLNLNRLEKSVLASLAMIDTQSGLGAASSEARAAARLGPLTRKLVDATGAPAYSVANAIVNIASMVIKPNT